MLSVKGLPKKEKLERLNQAISQVAQDAENAAHDQEVIDFLVCISRFHNYSMNNNWLIHIQRPDATRVAGFRKWEKFNRNVVKGAKGIAILVPYKYKGVLNRREVEDNDEDPIYGGRVHFNVGYVFDVSDTEGDPIPELDYGARGPDRGLLADLEAVAREKGITYEYPQGFDDDRRGDSSGGHVRILATLEPADRACIFAHELAHEYLHHNHDYLDRATMEIEAEAAGAVVALNRGLEISSGRYLACWSQARDTGIKVIDRMERIRAAADWILTSIEENSGTADLYDVMGRVACF